MARASTRKYTAQTKEDAVGQVIKAGLPLVQVARSFDMPMQTLENWVGKARRGESVKFTASVSDQDEEHSAQCIGAVLHARCAQQGVGG